MDSFIGNLTSPPSLVLAGLSVAIIGFYVYGAYRLGWLDRRDPVDTQRPLKYGDCVSINLIFIGPYALMGILALLTPLDEFFLEKFGTTGVRIFTFNAVFSVEYLLTAFALWFISMVSFFVGTFLWFLIRRALAKKQG